LEREEEIAALIYDDVVSFRDSISAEHGVGSFKVAENARYKSEVELALMRKIKGVLDPNNIFNPGRLVG